MATKKPAAAVPKEESVSVPAANMLTAEFLIKGTSPYVQNKFSKSAMEEMMEKQAQGSVANTKKNRKPKDFEKLFMQCSRKTEQGWYGIPAPGLRSSLIDACRLVNFKMTIAKQAIDVLPDGYDPEDGMPLVRILTGKPVRLDSYVKNADGGIDIRSRPMWRQWTAKVRIEFDADQFSLQDVSNLLYRAGRQVGIGAGRMFSPDSHGLGWGKFESIK